jgi:BNR repeat-like domain
MKRTTLAALAAGLFFFAPIAQADWSPAKRLTWDAGGSWGPVIAVDSFDNLHVVWYDDTPGNSEIYYKKSTDEGKTWTASRRLTWTSGESVSPDLALDSADSLHLVWEDGTPGNYEIYYMRSTDYGVNWTSAQRLTWTSGESGGAAIAVDSSGKLHVAWHDDTPGNFEIYYKKSNDGGATWGASQRLARTPDESVAPDIIFQSPGNIHVVWEDYTPGNNEIYYRKSSDLGATWGKTQRLTWTSGGSLVPLIALDPSDNLHLIWQDMTPGESEIYYKKSTNQGKTWTASKRITWASGSTLPSGLAADSFGNLHVVWAFGSLIPYEVYYKKSTDGGATWTTSQRLTWTSGDSFDATIAADSSGYLHVVWHDYTPGRPEIYYKKGK